MYRWLSDAPDPIPAPPSDPAGRPGHPQTAAAAHGQAAVTDTGPATASRTWRPEADRLRTAAPEQRRDHHDRTGIGLILIGCPGSFSPWFGSVAI